MPQFVSAVPYTASDLESNKNVYISSSASGVLRQRTTAGQVFAFNLKFREMIKGEALIITTFFESNVGGTITLTHPQHITQMGGGGGTPLIKGAGQTGKVVLTDGWPNATTVLKAGDIISFGTNGSKVYRVTADVTSSGTGTATLNIFPDLVSSPSDNATINYSGVLFNCVLKNKIMKYSTNEDNIYSYSISLVESL